MIRIGHFSRISQVPVSTLRYYDNVGLLEPVEVDRFTGYRYYSLDQLPRLNRILALKDLGFSLEQIIKLVDDEMPPGELCGMLRLKQAELRAQVQEELDRLERVEARLRQIEQENTMSTQDVVIKKTEPMLVASLRGTIPSPPEQGGLWNELETYLSEIKVTPSGACLALYHSDEPEWDVEVCEPLDRSIPAEGRVQVRELPAVEMMASTVYHGPFKTIGDAYKAILEWIEANGYRVNGPSREIILRPPEEAITENFGVSQADPNTVTEIQFPVAKV